MTWHDIISLHVAGSAGKSKGAVPLKWSDVPDSLRVLANRMKVVLDPEVPVEIAPSWLGARAMVAAGRRGNRIRLGGALAARLSPEALDGVMAHELAHIKCMHWELLLAGTTLAALAGIAIGLAVDSSIALRLVLGGGVLILTAALLSWISEYEADSVAAEYVGYQVMALTLRELRDTGFRTRAEFTHPPDGSRVRHLVWARWLRQHRG
ncbi:MAG: M48 family metalloprotease [Dehalococcoidia bacterium]|nr:M48 family metalloprotease [Dehalococcoidia bacterium]